MALSGIQRTFADILDSIWGKDAQTSIPTQPVSGIAYRDTDAEFESGQKYDSLGESSRWNQMLYLLTGLMSELTAFGILPWSAAQPYSKGALCIGSDGTLWQAQIDIAASPTNPVPPGTDDNVWSRPKISGFVPDSIRVIAGTGMTGGGPLSADVTLAAKLTDSVSSTDSTTAASATAVKTAYDAAQSKLPLSGGTVTGNLSIKNMLDLINAAPATEQELGLYNLDKNGNIMGGHDFVHNTGNFKVSQMYARNSSGLISSLGVYVSEDGTRYTLSSHDLVLTSDVRISRLFADNVRLIVFSGNVSNAGYAMRYSPDTGELYLDGRAVHGKADTAGNADTANYANSARSAQIAAPAVQWVVNLSGPQITVPSGGTYNVVCICFNDSGGKGAVKHYPNTAGGTVIQNAPTDYMVAGLCARVQKEG